MVWSVIITIAQWLDIFSSKIYRHLNFEKITAIFRHSSKNMFVSIRQFIFLPVNLPAGRMLPWLAHLMIKWSISGHLASHCVSETLQGRSGQLFWLKAQFSMLGWTQLPVGNEHFFADGLMAIAYLCFWTDWLYSFSYPSSFQMVIVFSQIPPWFCSKWDGTNCCVADIFSPSSLVLWYPRATGWGGMTLDLESRDPDFKFSVSLLRYEWPVYYSVFCSLVSSLSESEMLMSLSSVVKLPEFSVLQFPHLENDGFDS